MAKLGGLGTSFVFGMAAGAIGLYLLEHLKNVQFGAQLAPPTAPAVLSHVAYSNVGILPGNELPLFDYMDDSAPRGNSNVWDRRTTVYRNDGVLYNTIGRPIFSDGTTDWDPNKGLKPSGAYTNGLEDGPRPRQEHIGGDFPASLSSGRYPY